MFLFNRTLRQLKSMWTSEREQWCLVYFTDNKGNALGYAPVNKITRVSPSIDDPKIGAFIIRQMKKAGVQIFSIAEWEQFLDEQDGNI